MAFLPPRSVSASPSIANWPQSSASIWPRFDQDPQVPASLQAIQNDLEQVERLWLKSTPALVVHPLFLMGPIRLEALEIQLDPAMIIPTFLGGFLFSRFRVVSARLVRRDESHTDR
jgi:hypothetical protein